MSPVLCKCDYDASYVGEMGRTLKTYMSEHRRAVEKMDFSASALAQHVPEHDHHIDWKSTCVLGEAIYLRRQPSSLNRDRGTLPDMYDFIILWLPFTILNQSRTPYNWRKSRHDYEPTLIGIYVCFVL